MQHVRRLTPSPQSLSSSVSPSTTGSFLTESNTYVVGLRPRSTADQITDTLRDNQLPLLQNTPVGPAMDYSIIQRYADEYIIMASVTVFFFLGLFTY